MKAETSPRRGHGVVIGGSMAGLFAARVLAERFDRVTLVDRDRFPEEPAFRRGVPQSRHLHVFMPRGRRIAERLFPGLGDDLVSSGGRLMDMGEGGEWLTPAGLAPHFRSGITLLTSTRDLLEWAVRGRVASLPNVRILERTEATGLLPGGAGVAGLRVRSRDGRNGVDPGESLYADLVVDASGRNSDAPRWLEELGYAPPRETVVNAHPGYATRLYGLPEGPEFGLAFVQTAPPEHARGGILFPVEGGRWICTLIGMGGDHPPTDEEGFVAFARSLRHPMIHDFIKVATPVTPIHGYREIENRRRHYERLQRRPGNFLVTGDAACAFNPVYGQGMTTAALGAEALEKCLRGPEDDLSKRFQRRLAKANAGPWLLATGEDFRVRGVEGGPAGLSTRLTHRYMDRVLELSLRDLRVRRAFLEVFGMLKPPTALFGPAVALKVARAALRGGPVVAGRTASGEDGAVYEGHLRREDAVTGGGPEEPAVEHGYADLGGVRLHYVEAGEGPPVVLLHGFPEFWWSWRFQIRALSEAGFRVVAPDMRGYNLSDKPKGVESYRIETLARDVARLIEARCEGRAAVVGHDWGGAVAWTAAMRHPERVERLAVLNCPHPDTFLRGLWKPKQLLKSWYMFALQVPGPPGRLSQGAVFDWVKGNFRGDPVRPGTFSEGDIRRYDEAMARPGALTASTNYYRALFRRTPAQTRKLLRPVGAPVLVIWGERDRYLGPELAAVAPAWAPDVRTVRLPDASHWVQQDAPHEVNELLLEFLSKEATP